MPRPLEDWGLDPVVAALHRLAHEDRGIRDDIKLKAERALLEHRAIAPRLPLFRRERDAVAAAFEDLLRFGGATSLTLQQHEAVCALLYVRNSTVIAGKNVSLQGGQVARAALAWKHIRPCSADQFRRARPGAKPKRSAETDVLEDFVAALDSMEAPPSVTADLGRSAPLSGNGFDPADLAGTWRGRTDSEWLLKQEGSNKGGSFTTFMVVSMSAAEGAVKIDWLYQHGLSHGVSITVAAGDAGPRLTCIYEGDVSFERRTNKPSHRGACLLEISGTPARIEGPYWTDRATHGFLYFDEQSPSLATSFAEAERLFPHSG